MTNVFLSWIRHGQSLKHDVNLLNNANRHTDRQTFDFINPKGQHNSNKSLQCKGNKNNLLCNVGCLVSTRPGEHPKLHAIGHLNTPHKHLTFFSLPLPVVLIPSLSICQFFVISVTSHRPERVSGLRAGAEVTVPDVRRTLLSVRNTNIWTRSCDYICEACLCEEDTRN